TRFSRDWSSDVCSSDLHAHFQRALAGNAVEIALGQNTECLAQVREQGVAHLGGNFQCLASVAVMAPGVQGLCQQGGEVTGVETRSEERRGGKECGSECV